MLVQDRPLAVSTAWVETENRAAIRLMVSPLTMVYRPLAGGAGAGLGAEATGAPFVSLRTWPGKMMDFQPRPLSAKTEAVAKPKRPAMPLTVSPATTR